MESYIGLLLDKLDDPLANSRLLAHYVLALLIQTLRGERQVSLAVRILQRLEPLRVGPPLRDFADLDDPLSLASLDAMLKKPDSSKTAQRTSAMLLVALAKVVRPPGEQAAWLKDETPVGILH